MDQIKDSTKNDQNTYSRSLEYLAFHDTLTQLYNREAIDEKILASPELSFSFFLFDIDNFRHVNDAYGLQAGDAVLRIIADLITPYIKEGFYAARWGGDEFVVVCEAEKEEELLWIAENLRKTVGESEYLKRLRVTISGGIATMSEPGEDFQSLYRKADRALYHSRHFGGNRITQYSPKQESERKHAWELYDFPQQVRSYLEASRYPMLYYQIIDHEYHVILISDGYCRMMGADRSERMVYLNSQALSHAHPDDAERLRHAMLAMEYRDEMSMVYRHKMEETYHEILCTGRRQTMEDGKIVIATHLLDLTAVGKTTKEVLKEFVSSREGEQYRDRVTGLPGINYFNTFADAKITEIHEQKEVPVMVFYDILGMHAYNERFGYEEGNHMLKVVGQTIKDLRQEDFLVRYAEDHFVAITRKKEASVPEVLKKINQEIAGRLEKGSVKIKAGVYYVDPEKDSAVSALDKARQALNMIGDDRTMDVRIYDETVLRHYAQREYVISHFQEALDQGWIRVYYQPLIRTLTGRQCGSEALARWVDPVEGILPPAVFIKPLEDTHLIHLLDLEIIRQVCSTLGEFLKEGVRTQSISVNLSRVDFLACDIFEEIQKIRRRYDVPAKYLHIEITESVLSSEPELLKSTLDKFHAAGYSVWMDDFGSDYSSLGILESYRFDWLKIDMSFLRGFYKNPASKTIIASVVELAKRLGIHTLCEGVETEEEFDFLRNIGCELAQGYYFSRPVPLDVMVRYTIERGPARYEPLTEYPYYEKIGMINFMSDPTADQEAMEQRPLALLERTEDGETEFVFLSESYKKQLLTSGVDEEKFRASINDPSGHYKKPMDVAMTQAKEHGGISRGLIEVRGVPYDVRIRFIADDGKREMYAETVMPAEDAGRKFSPDFCTGA